MGNSDRGKPGNGLFLWKGAFSPGSPTSGDSEAVQALGYLA